MNNIVCSYRGIRNWSPNCKLVQCRIWPFTSLSSFVGGISVSHADMHEDDCLLGCYISHNMPEYSHCLALHNS
jgi:hypothetical protein